MPKELSFANLH